MRYPKEREEEFLAELREIYYRYYGASLSEIDPIQVIREAFQLIYSMNLQLPTRFLLLDRAIATLGSVGVELYPDFNVFEVARPYARSLLLERFTPRRVAKRARRDAIRYARVFAEAPFQCARPAWSRCATARSRSASCTRASTTSSSRLQRVFNRLVVALVVTGGLIGSSLIGVFAKSGPHLLGVNVDLGRRLRALDACSASGCSGASSAPAVSDAAACARLVTVPRERTSVAAAPAAR